MNKIFFAIMFFCTASFIFAGDEVFFKPIGPWVPLKVNRSNNTISVTGREYIFNKFSFMPVQIISNKQKMLYKACKLDITANGVNLNPVDIKIQYGDCSKKAAKINVSGRYRGKGLSLAVEAAYTFEFDGYAWVEVKIAGTNRTKISLDSVKLTVPFKSSVANFLSYARTRYYASKPKDYAGIINLNSNPSWMAEQFRPFITIANEDVGLNWFAENRKQWTGEKNQYILSRKDYKEFGVKFINKAVKLKKPLKFGFGFMALPIRKLNAKNSVQFDYAGVIMNCYKGGVKKYKGIDIDKMHEEGIRSLIHFRWGPFSHPIPYEPENYKKLVSKAAKAGIKYYPLFTYYALEPNIGKIKGEFMRKNRLRPKRGATNYIYMCVKTKEMQNFILNSVRVLVNEYGIKNIYEDCCKVYECNSAEHGCGDGDEVINYPIKAVRRIAKEVYKIMKTADVNNTIKYHRSGFAIHGPYDAFSDARLTGERLLIEYRDKKFIANEDILSAFRMTHTSKLEGVPFSIVDTGNRSNCFGLTQSLAIKMLHQLGSFGTIFHPGKRRAYALSRLTPEYREVFEAYRKVRGVYEQFDIDTAEWHPYNRKNPAVKISSKTPATLIKCSYYSIKGKRALLILANLSRQPGKARINIDLSKLGLNKKNINCFDHLSNKKITLDGNALKLKFGDTKKADSIYLIELSIAPVKAKGGTLAKIAKSSWPWRPKKIKEKTFNIRERLSFKKKMVCFDFTKASGKDISSKQLMISAKLHGDYTNPWKKNNGQQFLFFNGKTNYLKIEKDINKKLNIKTELSVDIEFKVDKAGGRNDKMVVYKGGSFQVLIDQLGYLNFGIKMDGRRWVKVRSDKKVKPNVWNRCAFTYDRNSLRIFQNGYKTGDKLAHGDVPANNYPLIIGANYNARDKFFIGEMKKLNISNKALNYESD